MSASPSSSYYRYQHKHPLDADFDLEFIRVRKAIQILAHSHASNSPNHQHEVETSHQETQSLSAETDANQTLPKTDNVTSNPNRDQEPLQSSAEHQQPHHTTQPQHNDNLSSAQDSFNRWQQRYADYGGNYNTSTNTFSSRDQNDDDIVMSDDEHTDENDAINRPPAYSQPPTLQTQQWSSEEQRNSAVFDVIAANRIRERGVSAVSRELDNAVQQELYNQQMYVQQQQQFEGNDSDSSMEDNDNSDDDTENGEFIGETSLGFFNARKNPRTIPSSPSSEDSTLADFDSHKEAHPDNDTSSRSTLNERDSSLNAYDDDTDVSSSEGYYSDDSDFEDDDDFYQTNSSGHYQDVQSSGSDTEDSSDVESMFDVTDLREPTYLVSQESQTAPAQEQSMQLSGRRYQEEIDLSSLPFLKTPLSAPSSLLSLEQIYKPPQVFSGPPVAPIHYHLKDGKIHFQDLGCLLLGFNQFGRPIFGLDDNEYISSAMVYAFATMLYECINSPYRKILHTRISLGLMSPYQFVCALGRQHIFQDYLRCVQWHELDRIFPVHQYRFVLSTFYHDNTHESLISMQALEQFLGTMWLTFCNNQMTIQILSAKLAENPLLCVLENLQLHSMLL